MHGQPYANLDYPMHATQCTYESYFDRERYHLSVLGCFGSPWFEECLADVLFWLGK